jgi:hypothetical protein
MKKHIILSIIAATSINIFAQFQQTAIDTSDNTWEDQLLREVMKGLSAMEVDLEYQAKGLDHSNTIGAIENVFKNGDLSFFDLLPIDLGIGHDGTANEPLSPQEYKKIVLDRYKTDSMKYEMEYLGFSNRYLESVTFYDETGYLVRGISIIRRNNPSFEIVDISDDIYVEIR